MLAGRVGAVMATDAIAGYVDVIEVRRCPGDSRMAVVAGIAADHVRRVFADGCDAVVAGTAITDDLCVIDGEDRCEHIGCVAVLADVSRLDVCRTFADSVDPVMAIDAIAADVHMIEVRRQPASRGMAVVAGIAAGDVRWGFSGRGGAVMTRAAGAQHLRVIDHKNGRKLNARVAVFADIRRGHVSYVLARGIGTVMAANAIAGNVVMTESCGYPADG